MSVLRHPLLRMQLFGVGCEASDTAYGKPLHSRRQEAFGLASHLVLLRQYRIAKMAPREQQAMILL